MITPSLPTFIEGIGQDVADFRVVVAGDRGDRFDGLLVVGLDRLGELLQLFHDRFDGLLHAASQGHRVGTRGDKSQAVAEDRLGQHGGGGGAVARHVTGLGGGLLHELGAHVLELVFQLDVFGDRHAVFGALSANPSLCPERHCGRGGRECF